ncbi:MAG TPA: GAF domain-containing protein, partial [Anaerolineales bacterium]|nr:GAF domain-containing protein [Anaerolineales bacterium]
GIGHTGIVGFVAATGASRVALDVGTDAVYFSNPDLPNTRSELALPLRVADEVIGVLDVQSTEQNVFQEEDTEVLSTLADQVAIAIQNGHSYEKTQQLLREAQKTSGMYLQESWRILQSQEEYIGYLMSENTLKPLNRPITSAQIDRAISNKESVSESGKIATLAVPIRLRDEVVGVIDIHTTEEHTWDRDEVDIAQAVAERLSLALETSLLLQTTQRRAQIERATSEISGKISSSTQFDSILRTAAEELSRILGGSEVLVQIQTEALREGYSQ